MSLTRVGEDDFGDRDLAASVPAGGEAVADVELAGTGVEGVFRVGNRAFAGGLDAGQLQVGFVGG
jgi:hypothetical protein